MNFQRAAGRLWARAAAVAPELVDGLEEASRAGVEDLGPAVRRVSALLGELSELARSVHPSLVVEAGGRGPDGRPELVVSADGRREGFGAAQALVAAAPEIPEFFVRALRPGNPPAGAVLARPDGGRVEVGSIRFALRARPGAGRVDVALSVPGVMPGPGGAGDDASLGLCLLVLDHVLGEYDVETRVGAVCLASPGAGLRPIDELNAALDQAVRPDVG